jgi:hypothetical protein
VIVLTIPEATPSLNRMHGSHWSRRHKLRKRWAWLVKAARLHAQAWDSPKWARARIEIDRYGPRLLDADNCRAGTKPLVDSLVAEGFIADDKPEVIGEPVIRQIVSRTERKTVVRVEAL